MELDNHVALVAGASRPIGRAIARKFAENGAALILPTYHDRPESTQEMEHDFGAAGYTFVSHPCDLTNYQETVELLTHVESKFGALQFLINNIERGGMPIVHGSYLHDHNCGQWELEFATTLKAKWNLFNTALPLMKKSGGASVINISSIAALIGRSGPASLLFSDGYAAANNGVLSFTRQWAREAAPDIRVNEVMLGLFEGRHGQGTRGWANLSVEQRHALVRHTLLGRTGRPEEIAEVVYFLCVKAGYTTGSQMLVDGGYSIGADPVGPLAPGVLSSE